MSQHRVTESMSLALADPRPGWAYFGRALFHPLRLALTARETGPEMAKLLPMIGRARAEARLRGQAA